MRSRPRTILLVVAVAVALTACGEADDGGTRTVAAGAFPMTVETCGREVTIEERPERVMAVGAPTATLMWAAGAADEVDVRARESGPLGPAESAFDDVPLISPNGEPSKEAVIGQEPDLLLGYGLTMTPWRDLDAVGIDEIVNSGQCDDDRASDGPELDRAADFEQIYRDIELYGRLFGTADTAASAVADLRGRVARVEEGSQGAAELTAAAMVADPSGVFLYGKASISDAQIEALGLTNAFEDLEENFFELNVEELLARDPDVLLVGYQDAVSAMDAEQQVRNLPGADRLTAVREERVIPVQNQAFIGGLLPIYHLEVMAEALAAFR